jgi:hypothetical protein
MSGYVGEIVAVWAKRKSNPAHLPKWCEPQITPIIGAVCDPLAQIPVCRCALAVLTHAFGRFCRFGTACANGEGNPGRRLDVRHQQKVTPMKTLAFLSAAFAMSFAMIATTVAVSPAASAFIA